MNQYLHLGSRVVVDLARLYLAFLYGFQYRVDERRGGLAVWYLAYGERLAVQFLNPGAHLERASALPVVVLAHVDAAARGEVGVEPELLAVQVAHGGVAQLAEVVGQNLRAEAHRDAFRPLCEQQRELHRQRYRLAVAAVVAQLPVGGLGVEHRVERKLGQPRLYVARRGGAVAREDVAPVALCVYEQVLLPQLHKGVAYGGVAVGVELHRVPHDVGHLVVASVVHALHRVEYAPLHGLQAVLDVRDGALQYHV